MTPGSGKDALATDGTGTQVPNVGRIEEFDSRPQDWGAMMPGKRSAAESIADRLADLLDKLFGPLAAPAKPAPVPVPVRPTRSGRR